ncbi:MAG: C-type lectin domain-containing protein [Kiritimatiellia bacterium]|nr:C-type lectin domain-containing protein [Kiritimatiellia bacterium]
MIKCKQIVGGLALVLALTCPAEGAEGSLASCKGLYEKAAARIEQETAATQLADRARYLGSLDKAITALKKAGDLDGLLAVQAEKVRFEADEPIAEKEPLPGFIADGRAKYLERRQATELDSKRKQVLLLEQYIKRLKQLVAELTRADKISEALAVKDEISKVEFVRADISSVIAAGQRDTGNGSTIVGHPADAKPFGGHWYKAVFGKVSWKQAKQRCEEMGGYLVCVGSAAENRFVAKLCSGNMQIYLGATDEKITGRWRWVNGEPFRFTAWGKGVPNGVGTQHYLSMHHADVWDDNLENNGNGFVCEWDR